MCDKQRLNFYRVSRLLLEPCTDTLRYFFEKLYSTQGDLQSFLKIKVNKRRIKSLCQQSIITSDQKEILKPSNGTLPLLSNLDITLLCILLTNLCNHQVGNPQCGWSREPDDKDLSTAADILRLRKTRNKLFAHRTNAMMTDSDFQETWGKTCEVISRLSSHLDQKLQEDIQNKINEIGKAQVDPCIVIQMFGILFNPALCKILDRIGDLQPDHTSPENAYHDGAEEAEIEIAMGYDCIICFIKLYPDLKSNISKSSITVIAKRLLDGKMISEDEYERLQDITKTRRCLVDMLLKKILHVDPEKTELLKCFFNQLRNLYPKLATKISQMAVTEADRTAFRQVKQYGVEGKNAHVTSQNIYMMTDDDISFFERSLCDFPEHVDRINDQLLSKFLISIIDHSLINHSDKKISALFKMVQSHNLDVQSVLEHVLEEEMLEEWKRRRCEVPVTASLDQMMQDNGHVMKDKEISNLCSTLEKTVVHIDTAAGDAKDDDKMTNLCRFFLLVMDPGKLTLQSVLEKQYSAKGDLRVFLKSKEAEVNILCSKRIIRQWQVEVLLPTTGDVPTVQNLDISTICILLIYLCQITKPLNGWKEIPSNNDRSTGADILRLLHATENLVFYHNAGGMSALEFNEKWDNIHGAISRLSVQLDEDEIDDIRSRMVLIRDESIDPGKEKKINDEIIKRFFHHMFENQEMKLGEIITMDVNEVFSDQHNQGFFITLLGWMRSATNTVMTGFARQFQSNLKAVEKRSIVIKLLVWKDLKVELLNKDFVGKNLRRLIRKGCVESKVELRGPVHVTVYILSPEAQGEKEEIHFHLELESIKHDEKKPRVHLNSQDMKLLVEEMDPIGLQSWIFDHLQIDVTKQKIMNEIVSWQDKSRCDQMEILLDSIKRLENGFDMLAQYCKKNDPYVYNKVFEKQEQLASPEESDTDPKSVWSSYRKGGGLQKLYSMQLDLDVEEQELLKMDTRSIQMYKEILQEGKEKVYHTRVIVVGPRGVGKTTLIKRLLGHDVRISERKSTEEIDVHTECCRVSVATGEWMTLEKNEEKYSVLQRIAKILNEQETMDKQEMKSKMYQSTRTEHSRVKPMMFVQPVPKSFVKKKKIYNVKYSYPETSAIVGSEAGSSKKDRKRDTIMEICQLVNENADKLEMSIENYVSLSVLDFAGKSEFYTTHQTFLTSHAIYLLVIDLSKHLTDLVTDDACFLDMEGIRQLKVHDSIEIWLNSIHFCAPSHNPCTPHVILVGTHVDKIPEKSRQRVIDAYFMQLRDMLKDKPVILHLMDDIAIDNTQCDHRLEDLKRRIYKLASQQPHWGEEKPALWLPLEHAIMTLKAAGCKVVPLSLVEEMNASGSVRIKNRDELDLFLRYHLDRGTILYFSVEGLRETIVLDPQWLIDAVNSFITFELEKNDPLISDKLFRLNTNGKLTQELIDALWTKDTHREFHDNKEHILQIMKYLNIIVKPRVNEEDGKEMMIENYFLVPCMVRERMPEEICPKRYPDMESSSVLGYVFVGRFLPAPIFHRLVAACISHWSIAKNGSENMIYHGCCVMNLDLHHTLTVFIKEYVIFVQVTRIGITEKTPSSKLCVKVREFITMTLSKLIGYLEASLPFELFIQCPKSDGYSVDCLIPFADLQRNVDVPCKFHDNSHVISPHAVLKLWLPGKVETFLYESCGSEGSPVVKVEENLPELCGSKESSVKVYDRDKRHLGISHRMLIKLSRDLICPEWTYFMRMLSVTEAELEMVQMDCPLNMQEQIYILLCHLNQRGSLNNATLIKALKKIGRNDLVRKYRE